MLFSILFLLLFTFVSTHNWLNSPSRSVLESQINPCKANPSGRAHAKVAPGQRFQIEWSVGHSDPLSPHYFIYIANKDFGQLKKHANFGLLDDYINNAPADQKKQPDPIYQKYHRKMRDNALEQDRETFRGRTPPTIPNFYKRQMKRGEDPLYVVRGSNFKGAMNKPTGGNSVSNTYFGPNLVNPDLIFQYEYKDQAGCLANDRRVMYKNNKYPWIIGMQRYQTCAHQPWRADFSMFSFPKDTPLGRYVIQYRWRGFYDCVDVDVVDTPTQYPYGTNFGKFPPNQSKFRALPTPPPPPNVDIRPTPAPQPTPTPAPTPAPAVPTAVGTLVGWWTCDGVGEVAEDMSGFERDARLLTVSQQSGVGMVGGACQMRWNNQKQIEARANTGAWDVYGDALTISAWLKPDLQMPFGRIVSKASQRRHVFWALELSGLSEVEVKLRTSDGYFESLASGNKVQQNQWVHVAFRYDGATVAGFRNGVQVTSTKATGAIVGDPNTAVMIGSGGGLEDDNYGYGPFSGLIDDVRVYQSAVDVKVLHEQRGVLPGGVPPLAAFGRVDHCAFNHGYDVVGGCRRFDNELDANLNLCKSDCVAQSGESCDAVIVLPLQLSNNIYEPFRNETALPKECDEAKLKSIAPVTRTSRVCVAIRSKDQYETTPDSQDPDFERTCLIRIEPENDEPVVLPPVPVTNIFYSRECISCSDAKTFSEPSKLPLWDLSKSCAICE